MMVKTRSTRRPRVSTSKPLIGLPAIVRACGGVSTPLLFRMKDEQGFPMIYREGKWIATTEQIEAWAAQRVAIERKEQAARRDAGSPTDRQP